MQVRIDSDLCPLVRQHAREQSRSIPAEVNFRLRKAYEPAYTLFGTGPGFRAIADHVTAQQSLGTEPVSAGAQRVIDKMEKSGEASIIRKATKPFLKRSIGTSLL